MRAEELRQLKLSLIGMRKRRKQAANSRVPDPQENFQDYLDYKKTQKERKSHRQIDYSSLNINDFEIFTTLGTGTFGRVRQVKLKDQKEMMALKMLKKTEILRLKQIDHIKSEKQILMRLKHPFIVQMKACFQDPKYIYMLFDYISGGELFSRLRKEGRFSYDVTLFYASEIYMAIQYLHQQDIAYRDLKPENLLIDKQGHIQLTDFGFAKRIKGGRTFTLCGTPEYLAPEIIKGAKVGYGKSVDWWALGVLIFEMLSGYPPFYDNEPIGIYKKIVTSVIEFPRFLDVKTKDIIRKLLNPQISNRIGVKTNGEKIRKHKWFRGVDWNALYKRKIPPPWIPVLENQADSQWFEKYPDSVESPKTLSRKYQTLFDGF